MGRCRRQAAGASRPAHTDGDPAAHRQRLSNARCASVASTCAARVYESDAVPKSRFSVRSPVGHSMRSAFAKRR
jgi:hypothetical protein